MPQNRAKFNKFILPENKQQAAAALENAQANEFLREQLRKNQIRLEAQKFQQQPLDLNSDIAQLSFKRRPSDISNGGDPM